jgi:colicin import membrane protein
MSSAALAHDAFAPRRPPGMRSGLALALGVHVLLVLALAWSVQWKTSEPEGVVAELWSALPQFAAPRVAAPEPPRPPVVAEPKPPLPRPEPPAPPAPPREDPQIAIERAKVEAAKKAEAAKREEARRAEAQREKELAKEREKERERQRLAEEQAEKKKLAEKARQEEARQAAIREANLKRMMAQAGASDDPAATGTAARTSGPSAGYAGRIKARIKPNIVLTSNVAGNPLATVEVRLAPDGTIVSRRLTKSSGSPAWDETVLRAIDKTEVLPRDVDGRVPPSMSIDVRPQE